MTGKLELLRILLDHGANRELPTEDGKTALDLALEQKQEGILELLAGLSPER